MKESESWRKSGTAVSKRKRSRKLDELVNAVCGEPASSLPSSLDELILDILHVGHATPSRPEDIKRRMRERNVVASHVPHPTPSGYTLT